METKKTNHAIAGLSVLLCFSLLVNFVSSTDSPAPTPAPHSSVESPSPTPKSSPIISPPAPTPTPASSPHPDSPPAPSPENSPSSSPSPSPSPSPDQAADSEKIHTGVGDDDEKSTGGMSSGKKAGIAVGVIASVCVVGLGAMVYKKRRQNIQRSEYGYTARRELL
ncbi:classical arabinogalactan protein 10-like [Vicia villosa]|uniref:classical arabinogalactan protein 10-like n=1 Tax=Vicia villosa TaxID=3911 RepID=UPI00273CC572|nr:classical arabinogalactan protein 10-like [Vicia villosa]